MVNMNKIVWVAVDSNGDEKITSNPSGFQRFSPKLYHSRYSENKEEREAAYEERQKIVSFDSTQKEYDHWIEKHSSGEECPRFGFAPQWMYLPKGSIEKLIGRTLTWNDEPVKIEE